MPNYQTSILISAPPEAVWTLFSDVISWPGWLPTISSVEPHDSKTLSIGARYTVHQPKVRPATWVVKKLEPPRRFLWESRSPGLRMAADHRISSMNRGGSLVELEFSFSGILGAPSGWLFRSVTERYLLQEATALKEKIEGLPPVR